MKAQMEGTREQYGLPVYRIGAQFYAVAKTEGAATLAAVNAVRESLWAFRAKFIAEFLGLDEWQEKAIERMQEKLCEDAQPIARLMLGNRVGPFAKAAINADGRGYFLAAYDGKELTGENVPEELRPCYAAYRVE